MTKTFLRFFSGLIVPRGTALFFSGFCLLNLLGEIRLPGFDANVWWIDLRVLPSTVANSGLFISAIILAAFAINPPRSRWRRTLTGACSTALAVVVLANGFGFYLLLSKGAIHTGMPLPLSLFIGAALFSIVVVCFSKDAPLPGPREHVATLGVAFACVALFPLLQMVCFGKTDYRRTADVTVVFGARVYADGRPSDALADRVRTACQLYRQGFTRKLLMSGGPGDGFIDEVTAMKQMAIGLGVQPEDILMDSQGVNTQATVKNSEAVFRNLGASRILVVSHFYHLPRIKLGYARAGREVYTVPAKETYLLGQLPYNMAREVAALWVYYLRPHELDDCSTNRGGRISPPAQPAGRPPGRSLANG